MKEEEKKHYAKKMEPYQRVIESYGFKWTPYGEE